MKILTLFTLLAAVSATACSNENKQLLADLPDGLYSIINTPHGPIVISLYYKEAPLAVENFVGLATGKFADNIERKGNYYDGLTFHRVVADFVAQGGDPAGNGTGGPGYTFPDEFVSTLSFTGEGILAMANSGPATNGSQFFITLKETPWLDQKHTIFGNVVKNMENVKAIAEGDIMSSVEIEAKGSEANNFIKSVNWEHFQEAQAQKNKEASEKASQEKAEIEQKIQSSNPKMVKNSDGIYVEEQKPGTGETVKKGQTAVVHYKLQVFGSSDVIDSSFTRNEPIEVPVGQGRVIKGWELLLLQMKKNEKIRAIIPPELAYGASGAGGGVIPPNAYLDFEMELVDIK